MSDPLPPFDLAQALDRCAKCWWGASLVLKCLGFAAGACIALLPAEPVPFIVAACTILAELAMYRSDAVKATAQLLRRKLDLQDSFGWPIPNTELSDLVVRYPASVKARAKSHPVTEAYFASDEPPGPTRALQNVSESAWWTKHLSETMAGICLTVLIIGIVGALVVVIVALQTTSAHNAQVNVARIVTGFLMLLLSMGTIRLTLGYAGLAKKAANSEAAADRALQAQTTEQLDAFRIMYDYHITRALGPIIPTWIWKLRQEELNQTWKLHRAKPTPPR